MIVQLLYMSRRIGPGVHESDDYITMARARNAELGITGLVLITDIFYLHCLEGERSVVSELYLKITDDPRHTDQVILRYSTLKEREFPEFSAEYALLTDFDNRDINTLCGTMAEDLHTVNSSQAKSLIRRLAAHLRAKNNNF